ncbi:zinc-binding dehydrogenase [Patescibacteria group bacterium]|nr:zinc-binding dehydrogenase [Patescibacteria group bacterium]
MKALMKLINGEMALVNVPEPSPGPGEVKVQVKATGICGTDLYGYSAVKPPVIIGHETAGEVVEIGEGVKKVRVGERITTETTAYICGKCRFCQNGDYNLCLERRGLGSKINGTFADYFVIREESIHPLPSHIDFFTGALTEPLACATHAVMEQGETLANDVVLVLGPGPLGLLVSQVAKTKGAKVIICGISGDEKRLTLAKNLGIDFVVNLEEIDISKLLRKITKGYGVDIVFECSGSPAAVHLGLELVRKRGRYIQVGILHQGVELDFNDILFTREVCLIGSHTQKPSSWVKALGLMEEKKVNLKALVTHRLPLREWERGFKIAKEKSSIKIILYPD